VLALMYGVDRSTADGWGSPLVLGMLFASAALFAVFVVRQVTAAEPLLHIRLFKDTTFTMSTVLSLVIVTGLFGVVYLLPLFLQQVHGYDAISTGLLLMPQAAVAAVLMPLSGSLTDRFGPRYVVIFGLVALTVSSVMLTQVHVDTSATAIAGIMALRGVAMGFAMMPAMSAGLARIPKASSSRASSITNTVQRAGSSVAIAVLVTVLAAQTGVAARQASCDPSPQVLAAAAQVEHTATVPTAAELCAQLAARASAVSQGAASPPLSSGDPVFDRFVTAYRNDAASITFDRTFAFVALVAALGLIPAWFLRKPEPQAGGLLVEGA
jgi:predicted MFS family arabinose efflux permease